MFGVDRLVYYRSVQRSKSKRDKAQRVVALVIELRKKMPRVGGRKLYYLLQAQLKELSIGRDKFFAILKANHLLIKPKRSYHVTTNSMHRFKKHSNLLLNISIERPNQVWVADITYIGRRENPVYLSLITDAYSKKIMGYHVADNLNTESSIMALKMAFKERKNNNESLIHHSDRGIQYCAGPYQEILQKNKILCSMTQNSDPYENAVAERINGILKQEFMIDKFEQKLETIKILVKQAVESYNEIRPHLSNHLLTPNQMHMQNKIKFKTYKKTVVTHATTV